MRCRSAFIAAVLATIALNQAAAESCPLSRNFLQKDVEREGTFNRKVFYDDEVVVFSEKMKVNTDGTARSYSPQDLTAELCKPKPNETITEEQALARGCAMNSICNGASVHLPNDVVLDSGQCPKMLTHIRAIQANGWVSTGGAKIAWIGIEPDGDKIGGPPCIDPANGFFVSTASALSGLGGGKCEQKKYVDALVPSIVVPRCWTRKYEADNSDTCKKHLPAGISPKLEPGDLVAVRARTSTPVFAFAVIGDTGPHVKLGEASVGLLMHVHQKPAPRWYIESYDLDGKAQFDVVIFRDSRYGKPLTVANQDEMRDAARKKFIAWGGGDENRARARLAACGQLAAP